MTPAEPPSGDSDRLIAEKLRRREQNRPPEQAPAAPDPVTLARQFENQEGALIRIVGETEKHLEGKIDTLARPQGAVAEEQKRQIAGIVAKIAKLQEGAGASDLHKRMMEHRSAIRNLSKDLSSGFRELKQSLDNREGSVFSGIDAVAKEVKPGAEALVEISRKVGFSAKTIEDVAAVKPLLDSVEQRIGAWNTGIRHLRRVGYVALLIGSLLLVFAGVALQRETGLWPPDAESDAGWRDHIWEHYGDDLVACIEKARSKNQAMLCRIMDEEP